MWQGGPGLPGEWGRPWTGPTPGATRRGIRKGCILWPQGQLTGPRSPAGRTLPASGAMNPGPGCCSKSEKNPSHLVPRRTGGSELREQIIGDRLGGNSCPFFSPKNWYGLWMRVISESMCPEQWFLKWGPGTSNTSITWGNFLGNANSRAHLRPTGSDALGWGPATCVLTALWVILMYVQVWEPNHCPKGSTAGFKQIIDNEMKTCFPWFGYFPFD